MGGEWRGYMGLGMGLLLGWELGEMGMGWEWGL